MTVGNGMASRGREAVWRRCKTWKNGGIMATWGDSEDMKGRGLERLAEEQVKEHICTK